MTKRMELTVCRTIPATAEEVFSVWLNPNSPGGPWFGAERVILNARVDGLFYHSVQHQGRAWAHYGRFIVLDPPHCIEHTWTSEATRGIESTVRLTLDAQSTGTLATLRHTNLPDDEMGRQHEEGWTFVLGAIAARFETRLR